MRRFIQVWLVASIVATGFFGYLYATGDRTRSVSLEVGDARFSTESSPGGDYQTRAMRPSERDGGAGSGGGSAVEPSPRMQGENLALTISIASSIVSALAAIFQTWLTHRAVQRNFPPRS
jgi:hypothetical protein